MNFIGAAIRIDITPDAIQESEGPTSGRIGAGKVILDPLLELKVQVLHGATLEALVNTQAGSLRQVRKSTRGVGRLTLASSMVENSSEPYATVMGPARDIVSRELRTDMMESVNSVTVRASRR